MTPDASLCSVLRCFCETDRPIPRGRLLDLGSGRASQEAAGVMTSDCYPDSWCRRPRLGLFPLGLPSFPSQPKVGGMAEATARPFSSELETVPFAHQEALPSVCDAGDDRSMTRRRCSGREHSGIRFRRIWWRATASRNSDVPHTSIHRSIPRLIAATANLGDRVLFLARALQSSLN